MPDSLPTVGAASSGAPCQVMPSDAAVHAWAADELAELVDELV